MIVRTTHLSRIMLALGAALAVAAAGCVEPVDSESGDTEAIASADQELEDGVDAPGTDEEEDLDDGDESSDPQPQPWRAVSNDPGPDPGPQPLVHGVSSTPSGHNE
jgi:hypothetical protein